MTRQIPIEKRTFDKRVYTINCSDLLDASQVITAISAVLADEGGLTFGTAVANTAAVTFPDGSTAAIGKAVQVQIGDGVIPAGQLTLNCTVRLRLVTNSDPQLEATFIVRLNDEAYPT